MAGDTTSGASGRRWHDMGGDLAALRDRLGPGRIDPAEHDFALWEKRVDALVIIAGRRGLFTVDGLRRALEDMGPEAFDRLSYYDRWCESLTRNLIEGGVISVGELREKMDAIAARGASYGEASARPSEPPSGETPA